MDKEKNTSWHKIFFYESELKKSWGIKHYIQDFKIPIFDSYKQAVKLPVVDAEQPNENIPEPNEEIINRRKEITRKISEQQEIARQAIFIARSKGMLDEEYTKHKEALIKIALEDQFPRIRREAAVQLTFLANSESDGELVRHMATLTRRIIRQKGQIAKLSTEQSLAVRTSCSLSDSYAQRSAVQLATAEVLDPRIRKLVLTRLLKAGIFDGYSGVSKFISNHIFRDSRDIQWDRLKPFTTLYSHPSKGLRVSALRSIEKKMENTGLWLADGITSYRDKTPNIPEEAFLQILIASEESDLPIKRFDLLFQLANKNRAILEELTLLITSFLEEKGIRENNFYGYSWVLRALLHNNPKPESLPLLLSCLKRSLFLLKQTHDNRDDCLKFLISLYDPSGKKSITARRNYYGIEWPLPRDTKPPALKIINQTLDKHILELVQKILPKKGLKPENIVQISSVWGGMEPFLIYVSKLKSCNSTFYQDIISLMGKVIAHTDPPTFKAWKKWRYNLKNKKVKEQVGFLESESLDAYANDYMLNASDILNNNLPELITKTKVIFEQFLSCPEKFVPESVSSQLACFLAEYRPSDSNFEYMAKIEISRKEELLGVFTKYITLKGDLELAKRAEKSIQELNASAAQKRVAMGKAGFSHLKTTGQIHAEIERIRKRLGAENEIKVKNLAANGVIKKYVQAKNHLEYLNSKNIQPSSEDLANLSLLQNQLINTLGNGFENLLRDYQSIAFLTANLPKDIDPQLASFLERYALTKPSHQKRIGVVEVLIREKLRELVDDLEYCYQRRFIKPILDSDDKEVYKTIKNLKIQKELFSLLAANPSTLSVAQFTEKLEFVKKQLSEFNELDEKLASIQESLRKENPGQDNHLLFVFTDNPLVCLTVGKYPEGAVSCQSYWQSSTTLAAYPADAMTKLCLLIDKNNLPEDVAEKLTCATTNEEKLEIFNNNTYAFLEAMIARRVTKIVRDDQSQEACIFLEPVYTSHNQTLMTKHLNKFALGFLNPKTGLNLVRGGGNMQVKVASSRNQYQYEDGEKGGPQNGGIGTKEGEYTMPAQYLQAIDF